MSEESEIVEREKRFWTGSFDHYERWLADDALMVFPAPVGILARDAILSGISDAPRWRDIQMSHITVRRISGQAIVLAYFARARRDGDDAEYEAWVGSVYVAESSGWVLAFHQQTPVQSAA